VIAALHVQIPGRQVVGRLARAAQVIALGQRRSELGGDRLRHRFLRRNRAGGRDIGRLRPQVPTAGAVHQLRRNPQTLAGGANAAGDDQRGAGPPPLAIVAIVGRRRQHPQRLEAHQPVDDFVAKPRAEVLL
jgi:hypothetical protein